MKWTRCLVLGLAALLAWGGTAFSQQQPARPKKPRVLVTISKETTYLTEPLRADGYVDYLAAVNQRCQAGVTPENNAAVLFWRAVGPKEIRPEYRDKYFQMLGIPAEEVWERVPNVTQQDLTRWKATAKEQGSFSELTNLLTRTQQVTEPAL